MAFQPESLLFTTTHEWVGVSEEGGVKFVTIGISKFAIDELSDVVFIELPAVGKKIKAGEIFGHAESVKALADLYTPVDVEITEPHTALQDNLQWIKEDPYGQGWIVKGKLLDEAPLAKLLDYTQYQAQCAGGGH